MSSARKREGERYVLCNDPSMTAWGWSLVNPNYSPPHIPESGCIKTVPRSKKLRIRAGDDRVRRIQEINSVLLCTLKNYHVVLVVSELPHGSQSAVAANMIGMTTGLLQGIADSMGLPLEWYSVNDAKRAVQLGKNPTKGAMVRKMCEVYGEQSWFSGVKYADEAVADSLAIFTVAREYSQVYRALFLEP